MGLIAKEVSESVGQIKDPSSRALIWILITLCLFLIYDKRTSDNKCDIENARLVNRNSKLDSMIAQKDGIIYRMNAEFSRKAEEDLRKKELANIYWDSVLKKAVKISTTLKKN